MIRLVTMLAPVIPKGWPSAIAPPFTLTLSRLKPSCMTASVIQLTRVPLGNTLDRCLPKPRAVGPAGQIDGGANGAEAGGAISAGAGFVNAGATCAAADWFAGTGAGNAVGAEPLSVKT